MPNQDVLRALAAREPIFHRPAFARTLQRFAQLMADDYWEIGASGQRYDRAFILEHLAQNPPADAEAEGWTCSSFRGGRQHSCCCSCSVAGGGRLREQHNLCQEHCFC